MSTIDYAHETSIAVSQHLLTAAHRKACELLSRADIKVFDIKGILSLKFFQLCVCEIQNEDQLAEIISITLNEIT